MAGKKNKIKEIHNKLSSSKINSFDSIINSASFSSVLKDRFISELKKLNIDWDLEPTTINKLVNSKSHNLEPKNLVLDSKNKSNFEIGIDIQYINDLPVVNDPWEEKFYLDNFNKNEIAHCLKKKNPYESFAGIFAVKEAIYKIDASSKKDNLIKFDKKGKPTSNLYSISISHDKGYAIGVAARLNLKDLRDNINEINLKIQENYKKIDVIDEKNEIHLDLIKRINSRVKALIIIVISLIVLFFLIELL